MSSRTQYGVKIIVIIPFRYVVHYLNLFENTTNRVFLPRSLAADWSWQTKRNKINKRRYRLSVSEVESHIDTGTNERTPTNACVLWKLSSCGS